LTVVAQTTAFVCIIARTASRQGRILNTQSAYMHAGAFDAKI
jgi:hypothetical protein